MVEESIETPLLQLWRLMGLVRVSQDVDAMRSVLSNHSEPAAWAKQVARSLESLLPFLALLTFLPPRIRGTSSTRTNAGTSRSFATARRASSWRPGG
jgi:hypothetical protein